MIPSKTLAQKRNFRYRVRLKARNSLPPVTPPVTPPDNPDMSSHDDLPMLMGYDDATLFGDLSV